MGRAGAQGKCEENGWGNRLRIAALMDCPPFFANYLDLEANCGDGRAMTYVSHRICIIIAG
jgi:hypothetical protein